MVSIGAMTHMQQQLRRSGSAVVSAGQTAALFAMCCLAVACASNPGGSPANDAQVKAAAQAYDNCLRKYVGQADDRTSEAEVIGETLAGYCMPEFSAYRALSGVDEKVNDETATRAVTNHRNP